MKNLLLLGGFIHRIIPFPPYFTKRFGLTSNVYPPPEDPLSRFGGETAPIQSHPRLKGHKKRLNLCGLSNTIGIGSRERRLTLREAGMTVYINPILIELGPFRLSWYGLMYVFGFAASYLLVLYQIKRKDFGLSKLEVENFYFYLILGLVIGARLGYVLFYDLKMYLADPLEIVAIWHGGMSFHGGLIGVLIVGIVFCWKNKKSFWKVSDLIIVTAPIGLGLGRIGNFINGELYGRITRFPGE